MPEKSDASVFREVLQGLKNTATTWGPRRWWPEFLFHHTDVTKAASILEAGCLYSREVCEDSDPDFGLSSSAVNEATSQEWHQYVRLYFRPKTPTFFNVEGFRPKSNIRFVAKQIVPVYLGLDFEKVICEVGTQFSSGNLRQIDSRNVTVSESAADFRELPFELIYHDLPIREADDRNEIICRRHAEVIVPNRLSTAFVRGLWCRSQAEYETLRSLLSSEVWAQWKNRVVVRGNNLFFKRWVFVDTVELSAETVVFRLNPSFKVEDSGPFDLRAEFLELETGDIYIWEETDYVFGDVESSNIIIDLRTLRHPHNYRVAFYIDSCLAYQNGFVASEDDLPF